MRTKDKGACDRGFLLFFLFWANFLKWLVRLSFTICVSSVVLEN